MGDPGSDDVRRALAGRTSRRAVLRWLAAAGLAPGVLAACGGSSGGAAKPTTASGSPAAATGEPIVIGVMAPLTGEVAVDGQLEQEGINLAVEEINAAGGVNGRPLKVLVEDGACDPAITTSAAQKLITRDKVTLLEGAYCSSATAAAVPVSARYSIPYVSALSTAADLTAKDNPWFSRFAPTEALMSAKAVPALVKMLNMKNAAIITFNDDFGLSYADANRANLQAAGVNVVSVDSFGSNTQDYSPFITKLKSSGADTVFVGADLGPTAALFKQIIQLGVTGINKVSSQVASSPPFIDLATPDGAEGVYVTTPYVAASSNPRSQAFVTAFQAKYNKAPEVDAAASYTAIQLFADALKRAGKTDGAALQKSIRATDMETPLGRLTFDDKGQGLIDFYLVQIKGGVATIISQLSTRG